MRPIRRPDFVGQTPKNYKDYLPDLLRDFGSYCSYCERLDKLDVEHVVPKSVDPDVLTLDWNNLLLGCPRCNRDFKRDHNRSREHYLWPDQDNTFAYLDYLEDGRLKPKDHLDDAVLTAVKNTIRLCRLDDSQLDQQPLRLARRLQFKVANRAKQHYLQGYASANDILEQAAIGFWSVWLTVFSDQDEVIQLLCHNQFYPNTRNPYL